MVFLPPILLLSALVGHVTSQGPSPTASAAPIPCHVRCFSRFMEDVNNSCKSNCVCAGSTLLSKVECCMTDCPADQQANVTISVQNACSDGQSLKLDYTCVANTTAATTSAASTPTTSSLVTSIILVSAQTVEGSSATSAIESSEGDGGSQGASIVGLGVGLGVGLPLAAVLVGGLALLWKRSHKKKKNKSRGLELGSNLGLGAPDGVGRTFVFPSTMVLPSPGLPDAEAGGSGDHKDAAVDAEITPLEVLRDARYR